MPTGCNRRKKRQVVWIVQSVSEVMDHIWGWREGSEGGRGRKWKSSGTGIWGRFHSGTGVLRLLRGPCPADVSVMNIANYAAGAHNGRKLQREGKGGIPKFCLKFFNFLN